MKVNPSSGMLRRAYYSSTLSEFNKTDLALVFAEMAKQNDFALTELQRDAWLEEANILRNALSGHAGSLYLEFIIPRMGSRIDALAIIGPVIFVFEFKVGEKQFLRADLDQVVDYALDLHHFHEGSHQAYIAPILICTEAANAKCTVPRQAPADGVFETARTNSEGLATAVDTILGLVKAKDLQAETWEKTRYKPTPTIIEATLALYRSHTVKEVKQMEADVLQFRQTSETVAEIIEAARKKHHKAVCFVTGVPGSGKTLVGLEAATKHLDAQDSLHSVYLSGNGPLVAILREALARDKVRQDKLLKLKTRKGEAVRAVKSVVQNVHHFRDECLKDSARPPVEHVAIFDEAQRAWNLKMTADFMKRKKGVADFRQSEPEFLLSCLDRHDDWAVVICLVGGGQEINTGEAGIREWLNAVDRSFPDWKVYISDRLGGDEYAAERELQILQQRKQVEVRNELHLATSVRSFRSEHVSRLVQELLNLDIAAAQNSLQAIQSRYPIVLTRDLDIARAWLKKRARGSERYGIVVSSQAERLKPHAVDIRSPINPVHWFLNGKDDVRSSYYLEDVATEFHVQGLELDWTCVMWDADFRHSETGWQHWSFRGNGWQRIKMLDRQTYLKNAYRVLLTRARQGMVVVVPEGAQEDPTRKPEFYDPTFEYLAASGIPLVSEANETVD